MACSLGKTCAETALSASCLLAQVDGGPDRQAAGLEQPHPLLGVAAQRLVLAQVGEDVVAEERRTRVDAAVLGRLRLELEAIRLDRVGLVAGDHVQLGHPVQHDVAAVAGAVGSVGRVERRGVLHQPGQDRGLVEVEVLGVDVEVVPGGGLDAVGTVAEVGDVEVALEDPVLGVLLLDGDRVAQLAELARVGVVDRGRALCLGVRGVDQGQLDHLLGDRRAALDDAGVGLVGEQRAQGALQVEGAVLVEAVVLDGHDRLDHGPGDLVERDVDAVLVVDRGDRVARGVDDLALLRQRLGLELDRQVVHRVRRLPGRETDHSGERDREPGDHDSEHHGDQKHHAQVRQHLGRRETLGGRAGHGPQGT